MTTAHPERTASVRIAPDMRLGPVHYRTPDAERLAAFYTGILGFTIHDRSGGDIRLGAGGEDLIRLTQSADAKRYRRTTGLYHTAFLAPSRWALAHLLRSIAQTRTPVQGLVDHHTHLAIYLPDTDGNGIELAWDYPKEQWPSFEDALQLGNAPIDVEDLIAEIGRDPSPWTGLPRDTVVGHVHLHVADLGAAAAFYRDAVGFDCVFSDARVGAAFFRAGDYHHHLGANVWAGTGIPAAPDDAIGLIDYTVVLPDAGEVERVAQRVAQAGFAVERGESVTLIDPFKIRMRLTVEQPAALPRR